MSKFRRNILYIDPSVESNCSTIEQLSCNEFFLYHATTREDATALLLEKQIDALVVSSTFEVGVVPTFASEVRSAHLDINLILLTKKNHDTTKRVEYENCFCGVIKETTDDKQIVLSLIEILEEASKREEYLKLKTLLPLYELSESFLKAKNYTDVYEGIISILSDTFSVPNISIMLLDPSTNKLKIVASKGMSTQIAENISVKPGENIAGWVFSEGKPIILNKRTQHDTPVSNYLIRDDIHAAISFPLAGTEKVIGVLNMSHNKKGVFFSQSEIEQLTIICRQAVAALENVKAKKEENELVKLTTLFEQYVSPEVAEILISEQRDLLGIGNVENLTVLFADIRNFTLLVQKIPPQVLREFLNNFFDSFSDVIYRNKGTLDKFMGDAALVVFGAPIYLDNPENTAVNAALTIQKEFEELKNVWGSRDSWFKQIGLGVGISKGEIFLGNVGSSKRFDYTVIGTEVNIAQRLASEAKSGQILITKDVYTSLTDKVTCVEESERTLRGVEKSSKLYSVTN